MKSMRIQNLRCFEDTDFVDIKPVTLLVGQNSSGKSTFLRLLPLLKQSVESRTTGPILWYGRFVDFGSFQEAVRRNADSDEIIFHFVFDVPKRPFLLYTSTPPRLSENGGFFNIELTLRIGSSSQPDTAQTLVVNHGRFDVYFLPEHSGQAGGKQCARSTWST